MTENTNNKNHPETQYLNLLQKLLNQGQYYEDRTKTGCYGLFGETMRFSLEDGFPLLTTKKLHTKSILEELFWFLKGQTNDAYLKRKNVTIWDEWRRDNGDLPHIYGKQWRRWEHKSSLIVEVPKGPEKQEMTPFSPNQDLKTGSYKIKTPINDPKIYKDRLGYSYQVNGILSEKNDPIVYHITYSDGTNLSVPEENLQKNNVFYPYHIRYDSIGCLGRVTPKFNDPTYLLWQNLFEDYAIKKTHSIDQDWTCLELFQEAISGIPYYEQWAHSPNEYVLNTEYFKSKHYGPKSCIFIKKTESFIPVPETILKVYRNKNIFLYATLEEFLIVENKLSLKEESLETIITSFKENDPSFDITYQTAKDGYCFQRQLYVDQIQTILEGLKKDPYGRRHILSAWNPADLQNPNTALPWCHAFWQFKASPDGKLHISLTQRSCDTFLGVPYNIASAAALLLIMAKLTNRTPGDVVWNGGDVHLYSNHITQAQTQLTRTPYPFPKVSLKDRVYNGPEDFTTEDFIIENYTAHPNIKAPVAS